MSIMYRETETHRRNAKYVKKIEEANIAERIDTFSQDAKDFAEYKRIQEKKRVRDDHSDLFKTEEESGRWKKRDNKIII